LRRLQDKSADPVAMLISLCKPISSFVEGYKKTLGEVLLSSDTYNVDKEFVHLERLKQYFPTDTLSACDAMLKDIDESKRINRKVHENPEIGNNMQSLVISRRFWPEEEWEDSDFELQQDYKR
jgi:anaphase-promoting complex subunit 2